MWIFYKFVARENIYNMINFISANASQSHYLFHMEGFTGTASIMYCERYVNKPLVTSAGIEMNK